MDKPTERKSLPVFFVKAIEGRVVEQIYSVFGVIDMYRDRIKKGAFKKTLAERIEKIRILWQHNARQPPIGVLVDAFEITRGKLPDEVKEKYPEATGGLVGVTEYLETERGEEVLVGIRKEAIRENSIGYDTIQSKIVDHVVNDDLKIKIRELTEIRLWDLSPVNWGANPATANIKTLIEENLPHHDNALNGSVPLLEKVRESMGKLVKADVDVPYEQRREVYEHLKEHYYEFDEIPPDFKLIELAYSVRDAMSMSSLDLHLIHEELTALQRALEAEPQVEEQTESTHFRVLKARAKALQHHLTVEGN
jgi:HK97 family phage prohead protease